MRLTDQFGVSAEEMKQEAQIAWTLAMREMLDNMLLVRGPQIAVTEMPTTPTSANTCDGEGAV